MIARSAAPQLPIAQGRRVANGGVERFPLFGV